MELKVSGLQLSPTVMLLGWLFTRFVTVLPCLTLLSDRGTLGLTRKTAVLGDNGPACSDGRNHERRAAKKAIQGGQFWIHRWTVEDHRT